MQDNLFLTCFSVLNNKQILKEHRSQTERKRMWRKFFPMTE